MMRVLVCPFGGLNLLVTLFEKLRAAHPERYEITYLSFTEYDRAVYRRLGARSVHVPPGRDAGFFPPELLDEVVCFSRALAQRHLHRSLNGELQAAADHYGRTLARLLEREGFEYVVLFNGRMNLFVTALDVVAERAGVQRLVFEQGLFRPDYVTIDGRGVNWRNSVHSLEELLSDEPLDYQRTPLYRDLVGLLPLRRDGIVDYKRRVGPATLLRAYVRMKLQPRERIYLRTAENRDLLDAAVLPKRRRVRPTRILDSLLAAQRFRWVVLCPFQVETDTQIVLHSPYVRSMADFVRVVVDALKRFNAGRSERAGVLFKVHPMHDHAVALDCEDAFLVNESSVPEILRRRCDALVTINSTAGIEAIEAGRPVITLGQAFYNIPGVISGHCERPEDLAGHLEAALTRPTTDPELQRRFIAALRSKYQVRLH
jgi:capsular polysaccharide export protein